MAGEGDMAGHEIDVEEAGSGLEQDCHLDDVQLEELRDDSTSFGAGSGAGLRQISDEISRQLKELDKRWIAKWAPQDLAIKNHERRIKALENRRPR